MFKQQFAEKAVAKSKLKIKMPQKCGKIKIGNQIATKVWQINPGDRNCHKIYGKAAIKV